MILFALIVGFLKFYDHNLSWLEYLLTALLGPITSFCIVALLYHHKQGSFKRMSPTSFRTDTGIYRLNPERRILNVILPDRIHEIPFDDIVKLSYTFGEQYALARELLLGFNVWDLFKKYRDTLEWFTISLVFQDGKQMPLFLVGQHQPREFLSQYFFMIDRYLLWKLGLFREADDYSRKMLTKITSIFQQAGKPIALTPQDP